MAKRLTEADIRRIFREESEWKQKHSEISEETRKVIERFMKLGLPYRPEREHSRFTPLVSEVDWAIVVQQVIDTYWEVVEEDLNESDKA